MALSTFSTNQRPTLWQVWPITRKWFGQESGCFSWISDKMKTLILGCPSSLVLLLIRQDFTWVKKQNNCLHVKNFCTRKSNLASVLLNLTFLTLSFFRGLFEIRCSCETIFNDFKQNIPTFSPENSIPPSCWKPVFCLNFLSPSLLVALLQCLSNKLVPELWSINK